MANNCYESMLKIAKDRDMDSRKRAVVENPETCRYLGQVVKLLKVVYDVTKQLEGEGPATIAKIIPCVLNALLELEMPEVTII